MYHRTTIFVSDDDRFTVAETPGTAWPILIQLGDSTIGLTYKQALALAHELRVAAGAAEKEPVP